jgi:hypothetical protein
MFRVLFLHFAYSNTGKIPNGNPHTYLLLFLASVAWSIDHFVLTALGRIVLPRRDQEKHPLCILEPRCMQKKRHIEIQGSS